MLEAIKQWAFTLVITAVIGGIANSFAISENGGMKKYVKFACSAVALAIMVMPIKEMFREMPRLFDLNINASEEFVGRDDPDAPFYDYDDNMGLLNELTILKTNELLKERIYDIVYEKTGIKPDNVYIYIGHQDYYVEDGALGVPQNIIIEKIIIDMPENTEEKKTEEVKLYLKQLFNCEIDIGVKINE